MTPTDPDGDDDLASLLAACDDALAGGRLTMSDVGAGLPPDQARLLKDVECVRLLRQMWPRQDPTLPAGITLTSAPPAPERLGRFRIDRELGRGGFGVVYLAFDPQLARAVALKVPRPDVLPTPELRERFRQEARAAAALDHPNIVAVYEAGEADAVAYIAAAYCPGVTLAKWLDGLAEGVPFPLAAALVAQLADGVAHAHSRGVLHRDLKPANVLIQRLAAEATEDTERKTGRNSLSAFPSVSSVTSAANLFPKITDFGLARTLGVVDPGLTATGTVVGTPNYLAPEQAAGHGAALGPAVDVYGLGTILYELLTRRPPFLSDNALETLRQVRADDPIPPRKLRAQVPRDLETVCLKCLEKEPGRRYRSAADLAADLRRSLAGEPILARPPGWAGRAVRWARRKPTVAALCVGIVAVALAGFAGVVSQWRQTVSALNQSRQAHEETRSQLYLNQVAQAQHEFQAHHVSRAERLLEECPAELRGWEWHYVRRLCQTDLFTLHGNGHEVRGLAFSPDGRLLAVGSGNWNTGRNGLLNVWDAHTGQLRRTLSREIGAVFSVAFHPDSRRLASGGADSVVRLWDVLDGRVVREFRGRASRVNGVAFSPDGRRLATCGERTVLLWDVESGRLVAELTGHRETVWSVAFSPDGRVLASGDWLGTACLWDVERGTLLRPPLTGAKDLRRVDFSPDGRWLAAATFEGPILLWDWARPVAPLTTFHPNAGPVLGLAFAPDGRSLAWHSTDGSIKIRDVHTGRDLASFRKHDGCAASVAFSPDGRTLASGGRDGTVRLWDATAREELSTVLGRGAEIVGLTCDPDGRLCALGGVGNQAAVWDVATQKALAAAAAPAGPPTAAAASPDGRRSAFASRDGKLQVRGRRNGAEVWSRMLDVGPVTGLAYSPDGRALVWGGSDGVARLLDADTGREVRTFGPHGSPITGVAFHPGGDRLVTAGQDGTFAVWSLHSGQELARFGEPDPPQADFPSGGAGPEPPPPSAVTRLAFSPDGRRLAAVTPLRPLTIWDVTSGRVALILSWNNQGAGSVAWSKDGQRLAAAQGRLVRVWDAGERGPEALRRAAAGRAWDWHRGQARGAEARREWFAAAFHLSRLIEAEPTNAVLLARRGNAHANLAVTAAGRYEDAIADFTRTVQLEPTFYLDWHRLAVLALAADDRDRYRAVCAEVLARFGSTDQAAPANATAWVCCLAPDAGVDPDRPVQLATRAVEREPNERNHLNTLAAALYRAGRYESARQKLLQSLQAKGRGPDVDDWLFLAMTHARLGRPDQARQWFDKAERWLNQSVEGPQPPANVAWVDRLEWQLLRREAAAVLDRPGP